jgi:hypothetical protein
LERSELPFRAVLGEVKYKISVFDPEIKMKQAKPVLSLVDVYLYGSAEDNLFQEIFYLNSEV